MRCARARSLCVGLVCVFAAIRLDAQTEPPRGSFTFRAEQSRTIGVTITEVDGVPGIVWPESIDARWDTTLLGVQMTADAASSMPFVEVSAGNLSDRQYFAPGDAGERWLNLSFLRRAVAGTRIAIARGRHHLLRRRGDAADVCLESGSDESDSRARASP